MDRARTQTQVENAPRRPSAATVALDVWRHGLPLVSLYLGNGSIPRYLLLTAYDLALGLVLIVGTTRDRGDPTTVDPRATWLAARLTAVVVLAIFFAAVAAFLTVPIGMAAFIAGAADGVDWRAIVTESSFVLSVAAMALAAGARAQHRFEEATTVGTIGTPPRAAPVVGDLDGDRRRSLVAYAAQVTLVGTYVFLSFMLSTFGRAGVYVFPLVYAALLVAYDARPDLAERVLPDLWRGARS